MQQLTIAQIRLLSGTILDSVFYTIDLGCEGIWNYDPLDTISADNYGTIIVTADGKRIKRLIGDVINARWFGAKGNGSSDDTIAIQNAINSINLLKGGVIFLPSGFYKISSSIKVLPGITLKGENLTDYSRYPTIRGTVLKPTSSFTNSEVISIDSNNDAGSGIMSGSGVNNITIDLDSISNTNIMGMAIRSLSNADIFKNIIFINGDKNTALYLKKSNTAFPNATDGILFLNIFTYYKTLNYSAYPTEVCILEDGCNEITFINCKFQLRSDTVAPATKGVAIKGLSYAVTFESCAFAGVHTGIYVTSNEESSSGSDWIRINNCTFETYTIGVGFGVDIASDNPIIFPRRLYLNGGNRFIAAQGGASVRNVLIDKAIGCTVILDEYAVGGQLCELTENALGCTVLAQPTTCINNSSTSITIGRENNTLSFNGRMIDIPVTYLNSWVDYATSRSPLKVTKDLNNKVMYLEGMVKNGVVGYLTPIFILPTNCRPVKALEFIVNSNGSVGVILVESNGNVSLLSGSNAYVSLSGIIFTCD